MLSKIFKVKSLQKKIFLKPNLSEKYFQLLPSLITLSTKLFTTITTQNKSKLITNKNAKINQTELKINKQPYKSTKNLNLNQNYFLNWNQKKYFSTIKIKSMSEESSIPIKSYDVEKIRNIGIIAHIDAGKTTTTERMLYYSGVIAKPGEVHHGNTVMDYMPQERERGITIRAAAVSFDWKSYQINLIDTPGHIDFTAEVERSLRVLDGAVVILDASMGVETQTITVWKQANKYNLPRIAFINKLDKAGASVENTLLAVHRRLGVKPILINYPIGEESSLSGLVDLIAFKKVKYEDINGLEYSLEDLEEAVEGCDNYNKYVKLREIIIEELANFDEHLMNLYLDGKEIELDYLLSLIRKLVIENKITLLLCGSSLKNKGVQQILDSVAAFFPSPLDTKPVKASRIKGDAKDKSEIITKHPSNTKGSLCGIIFKIINDKEKGCLAFFKLYEGTLKNKATIKYTNKNSTVKERIVQLLRVKADEFMQLSEIAAGDIGAIIGLKEAKSGDTFIDENDNELCVLPGVFTPEPVFFCAVYPKRNSDYKTLIGILENLNREDPSFQVRFDKETNQTLLCGLGELHLEIIRDRIELEYGLSAQLGKMKVSFRESIRSAKKLKYKLDKEFNGQRVFFEMELELFPLDFDFVKQIQQNEDFDITKLFDEEMQEDIYSDVINNNDNKNEIENSKNKNDINNNNNNKKNNNKKNENEYKNENIKKSNSESDSNNSENSKSRSKIKNKQKLFKLFNISRYAKNKINPVEADKEDPLKLTVNGLNYQVLFDFEEQEPFVETVKHEDKSEEVFKSLNFLNSDHKRYLFECILDSLNCGSLLGYQNVNLGIRIVSGKYSNLRTNELAVKICTAEALRSLLKECDPVFMEPFMLLEIVTPNNCTSDLISDLGGKRRGKIISIICDNNNNTDDKSGKDAFNKIDDFPYKFLFEANKSEIAKSSNEDILARIYALAPLSQLVGYAAHVRSITKGEGKFFMKFHQFDQVDTIMQEKVLNGTYFYE
jgi:elongation factor G